MSDDLPVTFRDPVAAAALDRALRAEAELVRERARADELEKELDLAKLRASEWQQNSRDQYEARMAAERQADELREALRLADEFLPRVLRYEGSKQHDLPTRRDVATLIRAALSGDET